MGCSVVMSETVDGDGGGGGEAEPKGPVKKSYERLKPSRSSIDGNLAVGVMCCELFEKFHWSMSECGSGFTSP